MKKILSLLLAAVLLFGCTYFQPDPTEQPVQPSTQPTVEITQPTQATSELTQPQISMERYRNSPEDFSYFVFNGRQPNQGFFGPDIDLTGLELGHLYAHDETEDKIYPISLQPVAENDFFSVMATTKDHLYFVLTSDPTAVVRTDYYGQDRTIIYRSKHGNISDITYYGVDPCGKLGVVENNDRFILYDIVTDAIDVVMEQPFINDAYYSMERTRPYVLWHGTMEGDRELYTYLYYPDTGECVRREDL